MNRAMRHGISSAPSYCPDCGELWSHGERLVTGDDKAIDGTEDWRYCEHCKNELFYPIKELLNEQ